jgi:hypothetical protein
MDCYFHQQGHFRIWSSSCKSVHNRSNTSYYTQVNTRTHTQPGIRGTRRLAPLATPHIICIETHRSLRDYAFPGTHASEHHASGHHASELPTLLQYTQKGYTAQLIQLLMDDLSANTHLQLHMYLTHEPHSSPFLKPTEAP